MGVKTDDYCNNLSCDEDNMESEEVILKVRDLMTKNLISIKVGDNVMEATKLMDGKGVSSILVRSEEEFVGIVTDRDIITRVVSKAIDPRKVRIEEVMSSPLITINAEATIEEAAEKMRNNQIRRLIVIKNHNEIMGIIVESDLIRVTPELHLIIRERSKIDAQLSPTEPQKVTFTGFCEDCKNYSNNLLNVSGEWLCEDCFELKQ